MPVDVGKSLSYPVAMNNKRRGILDKLKSEAKKTGLSVEQIQFQFIFNIFLSRLFAHEACGWILQGGTGLLLRIDDARMSKDLDLIRKEQCTITEALEELSELVKDPGDTDPDFKFELRDVSQKRSDKEGVLSGSIEVTALLGNKVFRKFKIDLSSKLYVDFPTEKVKLKRIAGIDVFPENSTAVVVPVESTIADKICACYERHRGGPSTRYHDVIDLVRIMTTQEVEANPLANYLRREVERREPLQLPETFEVPDEIWEKNYPKKAKAVPGFPVEFHDLKNALGFLDDSLGEFLIGNKVTGRWDPKEREWR